MFTTVCIPIRNVFQLTSSALHKDLWYASVTIDRLTRVCPFGIELLVHTEVRIATGIIHYSIY